MTEASHIARAAACLGDRLANPEAINARLAEAEAVLKWDDDVERRRRAEAEILDLTDERKVA